MRTTLVFLHTLVYATSLAFAQQCQGSDASLASNSLTAENGCSCLTLVQSGDTCSSITAYTNALDLNDFYAVNPSVDAACDNLQIDTSYCTSGPSQLSPSASTIAQGCRAYYLVQNGDYCQAIADANGITLQQFYSINPGVDQQCDNLFAGEQYCVQSTTLQATAPGSTAPAPSTMQCQGTDATLASGSLSYANGCGCETYVQPGDTCLSITSYTHGLNLNDFYAVNPSVHSNCDNLQVHTSYCTSGPYSRSSASLTIQQGCRAYYLVQSGNTCQGVASAHSLTLGQFYNLNPGINSQCTNLIAGERYCTASKGVTGTLTSPGSPAPSSQSKCECQWEDLWHNSLERTWWEAEQTLVCKYPHTPSCHYNGWGRLFRGSRSACPKYAKCW